LRLVGHGRKLMTGPGRPAPDPYAPHGPFPRRLNARHSIATGQPTRAHEHGAPQHLDFTLSHPSEIAPVNPALRAGEAGYQQSDPGAAVVVVGEEPVAFAALNEESTTDKRELLAFAKERQARYKLPTEVRLIEALPPQRRGQGREAGAA
jgi:hypothetical protein